MSLQDKTNELEEYTQLEGTEIGELCNALIAVAHRKDYCSSKKFIKALEQEIDEQLKNFKDHCKIVEREVVTKDKVRELEWDNE